MADTLITDRRSSPAIYKTIRRLGKGGMAEVFLARQEGVAGFRRLAVVKRLLPQFSTVSNVAEMLLDEARIAAQLNHPNIVQIYELGEEDGQYFIAMEYVDGCDLATLARIERRRKSRVPMRLALRVLAEAAMGLDYAHRQVGLDGRPLNLVHRDVSPHNVLCSREGAVKVTDFGIAKAVGKVQVTEVGVVKGKVHYMSPEQYTGSDVDKRSDIFSLGVVLYQLTTGRLPRVSKSGQVNMRQVTEGRIPRPSEIRPDYPEELDDIVMRALAQHPEDRYQDCAAFRDDVLNFARRNDLLAFPNELGDYVNALVPPKPTQHQTDPELHAVPRGTGGGPPNPPPGAKRPPLVAVPSATVNPPSTEVVEVPPPRGGIRDSRLRKVTPSGHFAQTGLPPTDVGDSRYRETALARHRAAEDIVTEPGFAGSDVSTNHRERGAAAAQAVSDEQIEAAVEESSAAYAKRAEMLHRSLAPAVSAEYGVSEPESRLSDEVSMEQRSRRSRRRSERSPQTRMERRLVAQRNIRLGPWGLTIAAVLFAVVAVGYLALRHQWPAPSQNPAVTAPNVGGPAAGEIDILSDPEKATVFIDGAQRCDQTPCRLSGLPLNRELVITVRGGAGYDLWIQRVVLSRDQPRMLLKAALNKGDGKATAAKAGADAGSSEKNTAGSAKTASKSGGTAKHRARRRSRGSSSGKSASAGKGAKKGTGKVVAVKIEAPKALVVIDVRPGWAEIWVDGQKAGTTPLQFEVPPGRHMIELKNPAHKFHVSYPIQAKKGTKIKITDQIAAPQPAPAPAG